MKFAHLLLATALLMAPAAAMADTAIGIVNIQQIMRDSEAAKSVREQLEKKQKDFQSIITKKEADLRKEDQDLGKQKGVLSKEAFEGKARDFGKKVTEAQKDAQDKKATLDNAAAKAFQEIQKALIDVVSAVAKEKNYSIVIAQEGPASQILYADSKLDVTTDVLTGLNKKLSKVDVKFEEPKKQ